MKYSSKEFKLYMKDGKVHLECEGRKCLVVDDKQAENQVDTVTISINAAISPLGATCTAVA